jgi:hypothetical protein
MINPHTELQFIADNTEAYAKADQELTYQESFKSALKALQMQNSSQTSISGKEMDSYSSEEYQAWCEQYSIAKRNYTSLKLQIETAKLRLEVWRSQEASNRTTDKILR